MRALASAILYGFGKSLFFLIFRIIFRTRVTGLDRVPRTGGLLVMANHISFADPPLIGTVLPRRVTFLAMVELFRKPVLGTLVRLVDAIPVDRTRTDHRTAHLAIERLRNGHCVLIFPEAGIRLTEQSVLGGDPQFRPGAGVIALLGGSAILPVVVRDTRKPYVWRNWLRRETIRVTIGHPFCLWVPKSLPSDQRRALVTQILREQLLDTVKLG